MIEKITDKKGIKWKIEIKPEENIPISKYYEIFIKTTDQDFLKEFNIEYLGKSYWMKVGYLDFFPEENLAYIPELFLVNDLDLRERSIGSQIVKYIDKILQEKNIDVICGWISHHQKSARFLGKNGI